MKITQQNQTTNTNQNQSKKLSRKTSRSRQAAIRRQRQWEIDHPYVPGQVVYKDDEVELVFLDYVDKKTL